MERINRYLPVSSGDAESAFQMYLWNCALSEAFYPSLHFAEIVCRNAIHNALIGRLGDKWYEHETFIKVLDPRFASELQMAVRDELRQHGTKMTSNHVVSALTYGFWDHLTTRRFERLLWKGGIAAYFPFAPADATLDQLHGLIESTRRWRNRIAHHRAIFDKKPTGKHQDAIKLIKWACDDTGRWVSSVSRVPVAIGLRPKH